jgi:hypothetical protein
MYSVFIIGVKRKKSAWFKNCVLEAKKNNRKYGCDANHWAVCHWMEKRLLKKNR